MTFVRRIAAAMLLGLLSSTAVFASSEQWNGQFTFQTLQGEYTITHSPNNVQFMFLRAGECLQLHKGSQLNDLVIPADVKLCRKDNVETFTNEVLKLGTLVKQEITLDPDYKN